MGVFKQEKKCSIDVQTQIQKIKMDIFTRDHHTPKLKLQQ